MILRMHPDRPNISDKKAGFTWYPKAKIASEKMKTRGNYDGGYPKGAIVHFTSGTLPGIETLDWGREEGYAFMLIETTGQVHQAHPLDQWGYHAGDSFWPKLGHGVSQYLVGIEIASAGTCDPVQVNGVTKYKAWYHTKESQYFSEDQMRYSDNNENIQAGWYHAYSLEQELALIDLLVWLKENDPTGQFSYDFILGHDEVSPDRKNDPGASLSMTMPSLRAKLKSL